MPIIVEAKDWNMWMTAPDPAALLKPCRVDFAKDAPSVRQSITSNDSPELIAPARATGTCLQVVIERA
jgi:putative SOS response-associated peptidase YedK